MIPPRSPKAYVTGRGSFRVRARWTKEDTSRGRAGRSSSPRFRGWCRSRAWSRKSRSSSTTGSCRWSAMCMMRSAGGLAPRHRAARPHGDRRRAADGIAVQAHRARKPHSAQHERTGEGQDSQGARPCRSLARMARPSPRGAATPHQSSLRQIENRLVKCSAAYRPSPISISIQRHPDHPQRGRAQGLSSYRTFTLSGPFRPIRYPQPSCA